MPNTTRFVYMIINKDAKLKDPKKKKKLKKSQLLLFIHQQLKFSNSTFTFFKVKFNFHNKL